MAKRPDRTSRNADGVVANGGHPDEQISEAPAVPGTTGAETAYQAIRSMVLGGALKPGDRIREERLADQLGVSRTPIREALRRLSAEGMVTFEANRGALVASWSDQDLHEIFQLRAQIEGFGARLATARMKPDDVGQLRGYAEAMEAAADRGDIPELQRVNADFHRRILQVTGNRRLVEIATSLSHVPVIYRTFRHYTPDEMRRSVGHHLEMVSAFASGDAEWAESTMRTHLLAARTALLGPVEWARDR